MVGAVCAVEDENAVRLYQRGMKLIAEGEPEEALERFNTIAIQWADKDPELLAQMFQNRAVIKSLQFFTHQRRTTHIGMKNDPELNQLVTRLKDCRDRLGHLYQLPLHQLHDAKAVTDLEKEVEAL